MPSDHATTRAFDSQAEVDRLRGMCDAARSILLCVQAGNANDSSIGNMIRDLSECVPSGRWWRNLPTGRIVRHEDPVDPYGELREREWVECTADGMRIPCDECGGMRTIDSGGFREDGTPIYLPCGKCNPDWRPSNTAIQYRCCNCGRSSPNATGFCEICFGDHR